MKKFKTDYDFFFFFTLTGAVFWVAVCVAAAGGTAYVLWLGIKSLLGL